VTVVAFISCPCSLRLLGVLIKMREHIWLSNWNDNWNTNCRYAAGADHWDHIDVCLERLAVHRRLLSSQLAARRHLGRLSRRRLCRPASQRHLNGYWDDRLLQRLFLLSLCSSVVVVCLEVTSIKPQKFHEISTLQLHSLGGSSQVRDRNNVLSVQGR